MGLRKQSWRKVDWGVALGADLMCPPSGLQGETMYVYMLLTTGSRIHTAQAL